MIAYLHRYFVPHSAEQGYSLAIQVGGIDGRAEIGLDCKGVVLSGSTGELAHIA